MARAGDNTPVTTAALPYDQGAFWDEMFAPDGSPRSHYAALAAQLATLGPEEVARSQAAADRAFRGRGITFAVHDDPSGG